MPSKFLPPLLEQPLLPEARQPQNIPPEDKLPSDWSKYETRRIADADQIGKIFYEAADLNIPDNKLGPYLEFRIGQTAPDLLLATWGLQRTLDRLSGRRITWRHMQSDGHEELLSVTDTIQEAMQQQPIKLEPEANRRGGYVVGSQIGIDVVLGEFNAWVEIADDPREKPGIRYDMQEMYEIQIK